jgi:hypothetical protein
MVGAFLFYTTSAAFRAEKVLKDAGLAVKLVPTPRQFSSDCGVALRLDWSEGERARALLAEVGVEHAGLHQM